MVVFLFLKTIAANRFRSADAPRLSAAKHAEETGIAARQYAFLPQTRPFRDLVCGSRRTGSGSRKAISELEYTGHPFRHLIAAQHHLDRENG